MSESVLYKELESISDKKVGFATLNAERSLNALSLEMVESLYAKLLEWQERSDVAVVVIQGAGQKAFCAGGDVVQLHNAAVSAGEGNIARDVEQFFTKEYKLDYLIHKFDKPILLWGHGIVMGGGLGLLAGASHRVVTERSRIAMPEITIGLYPDVGGSYFLNKMPPGVGMFLGLTGASINAADAKFVKLADHFVSSSRHESIVEHLLTIAWGNTVALNHQKLTDLLSELEVEDKLQIPEGNIAKFSDYMETLDGIDSSSAAIASILDQTFDDSWFKKAQASLAHGSPLSARIIKRQIDLGKTMSLADSFRLELGLSVNCAAIGDFAEGVRALLIDKDNNPNWKFATIHDVTDEFIDQFFQSPWDANNHPLKELK
ncbi:enoyl-CoA hydratase/isomerase family protein [Psychrosphaera ytuae]|uniref:3-hydroxyisobutyryl-CoA hydrolase n=1 Tax=Psychrosphaera ytuae TaxID=2820710 RepID=A0A975DCH9_9GAMM|nr:enoyl-CoA hydratase/isomerase family protein [Psychrosphaera ytuae]QTH64429.1 enoyl-CoA hydratase/isomerase family protein [Psychrosphaera ytuae]